MNEQNKARNELMIEYKEAIDAQIDENLVRAIAYVNNAYICRHVNQAVEVD